MDNPNQCLFLLEIQLIYLRSERAECRCFLLVSECAEFLVVLTNTRMELRPKKAIKLRNSTSVLLLVEAIDHQLPLENRGSEYYRREYNVNATDLSGKVWTTYQAIEPHVVAYRKRARRPAEFEPSRTSSLSFSASVQTQRRNLSVESINESRHMKDEKPDVKPKIKKEEEHFSLAEDSLIRRYTLNNCKNLHLPYPPQFLNKTYSRAHISSHYGGNVQIPWVKVAKHRIRGGIRAYAAPRTNWNPHMPRRPGECGLLFSLWINEGDREREAPEGECFPLFGRVKEGHWMYFGDYEFRASEGVSVQEWRELPLETKLICLSNMKNMKSWSPHPINSVTLARKINEGGVPYLELDDIEESLARGEGVSTITLSAAGVPSYNASPLTDNTFAYPLEAS
ncbi:hypothetical protein SISNIDRAFT_498817 [Sistotremastrum niveocremeum HHB9708]|uniref:DUF6697 domain-containing protein n=1 Tax=Sistotremastrum niveocremeum HHB9708 TaxID=1314777 RepID=A0A165AAT6_9AGAM|nr:hypothetical protein SISNIDRAFT_498817 [Sistotremastrum niveocremeum HHB9708]